MKEYHKIPTVFKRDPADNHRTLLDGDYATPELEFLADNKWVFTEKVDGTNIRIMCAAHGYSVTFGGKTDNAQIPAFLVSELEQTFHALRPRRVLAEIFPDSGCLYGEGYGAKIQKSGGNYRSDQGFVLFDVNVGEWWLQRADVEDVASKLGLDVVPTIGCGTLRNMVERVREGFSSAWGSFPAEGIVARPETELCTRGGKRIITKVKCKDFADA
ncbi:hypothetical protein LCGC14_2867840 [marine sediment metagenome]|uniref:RNA ligase domain-containing protein n=1 Tax=marine sediment metagenome TaxID=412755 RepID=A0A0F9AUZ4_9ZZZZ